MRVFVNKDWKYEDYFIIDRTHLRFFTQKSIKRMYEESNFEVVKHSGINKSKSIKAYLFHTLTLFTQIDMQYVQFAKVVKKANED